MTIARRVEHKDGGIFIGNVKNKWSISPGYFDKEG